MDRMLGTEKRKLFLLATVSLVFAGSSAFAQTLDESVTVKAPHAHTRVIKPAIGRQSMPLKRVSYNVPVSYSDLDLTRRSDVSAFRERIRIAALEACNRLDTKFMPSIYISEPPEQNCVGNATKAGLARANMIIDEARK